MREGFRLPATVAQDRASSVQFSPSLLRTCNECFTLKIVGNKGDKCPTTLIATMMTEATSLSLVETDREWPGQPRKEERRQYSYSLSMHKVEEKNFKLCVLMYACMYACVPTDTMHVYMCTSDYRDQKRVRSPLELKSGY